MTHQKIISLIQELHLVFDIVRLVDITNNTQYTLNDANELEPSPYKCYTVWNRDQVCNNCISARACCNKTRIEKFEVIGHEVCHVISMCIDVDEKPFALELVAYIQEDSIFGASGRENFAQSLSDYIQQIYADPLTNAYNRRYYTEQSEAFANAEGVAMIDVDNFKAVNDTYGHQAGDETLRLIVRGIIDCIRSSDILIRYGGDEFLLFFPSIPSDIFASRLEEIRRRVESITVPGCPNFKPTVSIGGVYGAHPLADAIHRADLKMYDAKHERNHVSVSILPPPTTGF